MLFELNDLLPVFYEPPIEILSVHLVVLIVVLIIVVVTVTVEIVLVVVTVVADVFVLIIVLVVVAFLCFEVGIAIIVSRSIDANSSIVVVDFEVEHC